MRGEAHFARRERGRVRSSGPCWPERSRNWPLSCGRWSSRVFSLGWPRLDHFKFVGLDFLHASAQCFAEDCSTTIDLAQAGVPATLGDGGEVIHPLDIVEVVLLAQFLGDELLKARARSSEKLTNQLDGARFVARELLRKLFCLSRLRAP